MKPKRYPATRRIRPFGDPISAVMAIDMLKGLMAAVTQTAVNLHGPVR
jgi:glycerol-3-phosphate acyltransferase PlsY